MTHPVPSYTIQELEKWRDIEFPSFSNDDALNLGLVAAGVIRDHELELAVDIVVRGDLVFRAMRSGTGAGNFEWLAGKAAAVLMHGEPSLLDKLRRIEAGTDNDPEPDGVKFFGGSVPIRVAGEIIGTLTMSGQPDAIDHEMATEAVTRYLAAYSA
ncbi:MAG TPA: heme-binding protein [Pseudolysinimonas sp.]|nr:heme-binding protein [Pseudolysinimonas sp.]